MTPETWVYRKGRSGEYAASGSQCLACDRKRKAEYEERRDKIALAVKEVSVDAKGKPTKLDVNQALKVGGRVLNEFAPAVMSRVIEYLEDPSSEHHIWALELLAQRILPRKLYEELGGQAAGVGSLGDKRPVTIVNVYGSGEAPARVIDAETVEEIPPQLEERESSG